MGHMREAKASLHGLLAGREVSLRVAINKVGDLADACGRLLTDTAFPLTALTELPRPNSGMTVVGRRLHLIPLTLVRRPWGATEPKAESLWSPKQSFTAGVQPDGNVCRAELDRVEVPEAR